MENIGQYKGIFYNNKTTHRFYEGGAHFSYIELVKILKDLKKSRNNDSFNTSLESSSSSNRKEKTKLINKMKINMLSLSKQKNQSSVCLLKNNKKVKADEIYNKIVNDQLDLNKNVKMKFLQKVKNVENEKYIKKERMSNKNFNSSIYNLSNHINMPLIYTQRNKNNNKFIQNKESGNFKEFKKIKYLRPINKKKQNMNSTIGFNEKKQNNKYYLINNFENSQNILSNNKNMDSSRTVNKSLNKNNNIMAINKFQFMNKLKNKSNSVSKNNNSNSVDFNIKINNIVKINDQFFNNTKLNFNTDKNLKKKLLCNDSKNKENKNVNISVFNFSKLKYSKKFYISKNSK